MGLDFAVSQLEATGWRGLQPGGCGRLADGRVYPEPARVAREFAEAGFVLRLRHVALFDCYRAEWTESAREAPDGSPGTPGAEPARTVVGRTCDEAAVYALALMRRSAAVAAV
ncbi:MAG: hypothetical protein ACF8LK_08550 [Phycisphaerales bacterium JB041]